jgi:hypothetical protein
VSVGGRSRWPVPLTVVLVLSGCGGAQDESVRSTVDRFYEALDADDGASACAVLAPRTRDELEQSAGKPCDDAILEEDLTVPAAIRQVHSFGTAAQVQWTGETTFLSRFREGWRVVAAGCSPVPPDRYDCEMEAG